MGDSPPLPQAGWLFGATGAPPAASATARASVSVEGTAALPTGDRAESSTSPSPIRGGSNGPGLAAAENSNSLALAEIPQVSIGIPPLNGFSPVALLANEKLPDWLLDDPPGLPDRPVRIPGEPPPNPLLYGNGLRKRKLCIHFDQGTCRRGSECNFAHGVAELVTGSMDADYAHRPQTKRMDFSGLDAGRVSRTIEVPADQVDTLMTEDIKQLLIEVTGAYEVRWMPDEHRAIVMGTAAQLEKADQLLRRVTVHCQWGVNELKIRSVLRPRTDHKSARLRLSPMVPALKVFSKILSVEKPQLTIGTDPANDVRVQGQLLSRCHTVLEFSPERGAVYVVDSSTNGTFLNGRRLPPKSSGKVLLWHGDELLLQDPGVKGGAEFGYMVNIEMC